MNDTGQHWERAYTARSETEVSWFQPRPERSLQLISAHAADTTTSIIDVGGGASRLVDALLPAGYRDLTVLDIAAAALAKSRARLGDQGKRVAWIVADVTEWRPQRTWGVWHDRAVFHFLTAERDQDAYVAAMTAATAPGSIVIISTFAPDGPERCSGLPVQRYSAQGIAERLGGAFALEAESAERHTTPSGATQSFMYAVLRRG